MDWDTVPFEQETEQYDTLMNQLGTSKPVAIPRHVLPVTTFGSGMTNLAAKIANLMWSISLDIGFHTQYWDRYRNSVVSTPIWLRGSTVSLWYDVYIATLCIMHCHCWLGLVL